jgi:hypothetical protein
MNATPEQREDRAVISRATTAYNAIKPKRAEVIEAALSVEGLIDEVILDVLVGRDTAKRALFKEAVLLPEFCTSFQKWKMLRKMMSEVSWYFGSLSEADGSTLRTDIKTLIEERNKFAHGDLIVDVANDYVVVLRYYQDGIKYLRITDQLLNDLLEIAQRCRETLWNLHKRFGTDIETMVV